MTVKLVGRDDIALSNVSAEGYLIGTQFTANASGDVTEIRFRVAYGISGEVYIGIYTDSGGSPSVLLGQKHVSVSAGEERVITATLDSAIAVVNGTLYWIVSVSQAYPGIVGERAEYGHTLKYREYPYAPLPNPAGSGWTTETDHCSISAGWGTAAAPVNWTKSISDIITITDAISKAASIHKVDAIAIADAVSKAIGVTKSDTIAITDAKIHLGDGIGFHNAVSQRRYKAATFSTFTFPDPAGIGFTSASDGYYMIAGWGSIGGSVKEVGLFRDDTMAIADAIAGKSIGLNKIDSIAITDVFTKASEFYRSMADTVTIADVFSKASEFYRSMSDTVIISDSTGKAIGINKAELITITDAISKAISILKADILAIVDLEIKTIGKNLVDLIIITDGFVPIGALLVPPGIYIIEIHDSDGSLVAILEKAYNISLETKTNAPAVLTFSIPSDESKLSYLTRARELWVRDYDNKTVIAKTKLLRKEDVRD